MTIVVKTYVYVAILIKRIVFEIRLEHIIFKYIFFMIGYYERIFVVEIQFRTWSMLKIRLSTVFAFK